MSGELLTHQTYIWSSEFSREKENLFYFLYFFSYPKNSSLGLSPEQVNIKKVTFQIENSCCCLEKIKDYSKIPSEKLEKVPLFLLTPDNSPLLLRNLKRADINSWILKSRKSSFQMKIQYLGESVKYKRFNKKKGWFWQVYEVPHWDTESAVPCGTINTNVTKVGNKGWQVYEVPHWDTESAVPCGRINANFTKVGNKGYLYGGYVPCEWIEFYDGEGNFAPRYTSKPKIIEEGNIEVCAVNDLWEFDFVEKTWELLVPLELRPINKFQRIGAPEGRLLPSSEDSSDKEDDNRFYRKVTTAIGRKFVEYQEETLNESHPSQNIYWRNLSATIQCFDETHRRIIYIGYENISMLGHLTVSVFDCEKRNFTIFATHFMDLTLDLLDAFYNHYNDSLFLSFFGLLGMELYIFSFKTGSINKIIPFLFNWRQGGKLISMDDNSMFLNLIFDEPEVTAKCHLFENRFKGHLHPDKQKQQLHFQILSFPRNLNNNCSYPKSEPMTYRLYFEYVA